MAYYNGKKVLSVVQVKEVEVDYYVGVATLENEKKDEIVVPSTIEVNNTNFPILDGTKTSIVELGGNSVSFNQLVSDTQIFSSGSNLSVDYNNTTHQYTFKTNSTDWAVSNANNFTWINGHKYLVKINLISKTENAKLRLRYPTIINETSIITPTENLNLFGIQIQSTDGNEATIIFTINVFDLTRMSLDNITSVDEFKALFPLDIYPYNAGEIKSTIVSKIESWGYNLLNRDTLELGWIVQGVDRDEGGYAIRTQGFIKVTGGKAYSVERFYSENNNANKIAQYDADYNFIKETATQNNPYSITLENNCQYVRLGFYLNTSVQSIPSTFNACFHLAGSRNGYAPYVGKLGQINIPNAPLTLNGVNNIHDTLAFEEQSDGTYNAILTRKFLVLDLGTINWGSPNSNGWVQSSETIPAKPSESSSKMPNAICDKYPIGTPNKAYTTDGYISINTSSYLTARESSFIGKTRDEMKTIMSGVMFYSELATPTSEVIATGLTFDQVATLFEKGGTLEIVNANTDYIQTNSVMAFAVRRFRTTEE